jgi:hypothetical protein
MEEKGSLLHEKMREFLIFDIAPDLFNFYFIFNSAWYFAIQSDQNSIICSSSMTFRYNR